MPVYDESLDRVGPPEPRNQDEHVERVRSRAQAFLDAVTAANEAGVSQALILPMLVGMLRDSGMMPSFDPSALLG